MSKNIHIEAREDDELKRIAGYWTPERMREAKPAVPPKPSPNEPMRVASDGVIDYPLCAGQALTGAWAVTPNPTGPAVAADAGFLHYSVNQQPAVNQWLFAAITTQFPTANGVVVEFDIRASTIQGDEVKFQVWRPQALVLRFVEGGNQVAWQWWGPDGFQTLAASSVRADGTWRHITMVYAPTQVSVFEDGAYMFTWNTSIGPSVAPAFDMQVLTQGANLSFDVGRLYVSPATFADGVSTPWDYAFAERTTPPSEAVGIRSAANGLPHRSTTASSDSRPRPSRRRTRSRLWTSSSRPRRWPR